MSNEAPAGPAEPTPVPAPAAPAPKKGASRIVTPILALVAALIIGLFGGVIIGHSTASATPASRVGGFGQGGTRTFEGPGGTTNGARGFGGNFTSGTVVSVSGGKVVIKETDGTQVTVNTSGSTKVTKTSSSAVSDLAAGETITVIGAKDASGNVTATTIAEGQTGFGTGRAPGAGGTGGNG